MVDFENTDKTGDESSSDLSRIVANRYLFWFEHEGKEGWTFEIEAKNYDEAFEKAYDTHGPQVEGMMYQLL